MDEQDKQMLKRRRMSKEVLRECEDHLPSISHSRILRLTIEIVKALEALEACEAEKVVEVEKTLKVEPEYGLYWYFQLDTKSERNDKRLVRAQRQLARRIEGHSLPSLIHYYKDRIRSRRKFLATRDRAEKDFRPFSDLRDVEEKYAQVLAAKERYQEPPWWKRAKRRAATRCRVASIAEARKNRLIADMTRRCKADCESCYHYALNSWCKCKNVVPNWERLCDWWEGDER